MPNSEEILGRLSLREKLGQLMFFGWQGANIPQSQSVNGHARALIEELHVGGIIFMGRNVDTPAQLRRVTSELQALNAEAGRPALMLGVDQEGGRVNRLVPPNFTRQPSAQEIGETRDPQRARLAAAGIAAELTAGGLSLDFAPVLDVNNNPNNPVINDRSYGSEPDLVARMGVAAMRGFQDDGRMMACGKHFPGHGDTDVDSHLALPTIAHDRARLDAIELVPFRAAIDAGISSIMTAHILFKQIDPALPATLSPAILTGLLREELGFDGLIVTDCLEMKGVADHWGTAKAAVLAVEAGADVLLCCHTWSLQRGIRDALLDAVASGRISESRIDQSFLRVLNAKSKWLSVVSE